MAWYDSGTVAVTNGSTTVTGTGTNFISGAQVGEAFLAPDDKLYEIASITSATVLVLADAYLGSTQSGQDYKIVPTQSLVADLASDVTDLIADYADVKDKAGAGKFNDGSVTAPAITFEQDQNNGLYRIGSDNYGLSAGGTKQIDISTTDVELNYSGSKKLATTSTGVDVTGTLVSDGLTVDTGSPFSFTGTFGNGDANKLVFINDDGAGRNQIDSTSSGGAKKLDLATGGLKRVRLDDNGNVSFFEDTGTTAKMVWDASEENLTLTGGWVSSSGWQSNGTVYETASSIYNGVYGASANNIALATAGSERMRLDSSGNLLVGTTNQTWLSQEGIRLFSSGSATLTGDGIIPLAVNRLSSDGDIINFRKDGTTVGSIGVISNDVTLGKGSAGIRFNGESSEILPHNMTTNVATDGVVNLGYSSTRFNDIYAVNGTINTSDRNEKQDIEVLNEAEQRVAQSCKGLLRKFRWIDAVEEKGDDARIHFGIIAQDLQDAFTAEGLDAGRYAMFISTTWTDKETGEERTRLGVRYSELLAFIISAL